MFPNSFLVLLFLFCALTNRQIAPSIIMMIPAYTIQATDGSRTSSKTLISLHSDLRLIIAKADKFSSCYLHRTIYFQSYFPLSFLPVCVLLLPKQNVAVPVPASPDCRSRDECLIRKEKTTTARPSLLSSVGSFG